MRGSDATELATCKSRFNAGKARLVLDQGFDPHQTTTLRRSQPQNGGLEGRGFTG